MYLCPVLRAIPHIITSANLISGVFALVFLGQGELIFAAYCIFIAGILDFFDGFAARLLKVSGEFGKQLDSLADVVTFGVVPGMMLYHIAEHLTIWPFNKPSLEIIVYLPLLIPVFSALRLAKFNIDTRQSVNFIGVPTPANAFWLASIPFIIRDYPFILSEAWFNPYSISLVALISCALLVSPISLFSLKIKSFTIANAWPQYLFLISMGISLIVFKFAGLFALLPLYLLLSIIKSKQNKNEIPG